MKLLLLLQFALRRLRENQFKSQTTFLGVIVAVIFMLLLLGLGFGLDTAVQNSLLVGSHQSQITVTPAQIGSLQITDTAVNQIKGLSNVKEANVQTNLYGKVASKGKYLDVYAQAVSANYLSNMGLTLPDNTAFNYYPSEPNQLLIVNQRLAEIYGFSAQSILGQPLTLDIFLTSSNSLLTDSELNNGRKQLPLGNFSVIKVLETGDQPEVYFPIELATKAGLTAFSSLQVIAVSQESIPTLVSKIEALGFGADSMAQNISGVERFFLLLRMALFVFSLITCIIATIGLINLLSLEVSERREEIAFMRLLGFTEYEVRAIVVFECITLSLMGVIIGMGIGYGIALIGNKLFGQYASSHHFSYFDLFILPFGVILSIGVSSILYGLLVGWIASWKVKQIPASLGSHNV